MRRSVYLLAILIVFGCTTKVESLLDDSDFTSDPPIDTATATETESTSDTGSETDTTSETHQDSDSETIDTSSDSDTDTASETTPEPVLHPLTPAELNALLPTKDFEMINVHIPDEGEVPGTDVHISYLDPAAVAAHIGGDLGVMAVIYCKSNGMAMVVGADLLAMGYYNIHYLDGGMNGWENAGYSLN